MGIAETRRGLDVEKKSRFRVLEELLAVDHTHRANRPELYHTRGKHHTGTLIDRLPMSTSNLHRSGQHLCIWVRTRPGTNYHKEAVIER